MRGSIEFSTREIIILLLMVIIVSLIIVLGVRYINKIKDIFVDLLGKI